MMADVGGRPLIEHTIEAVKSSVDRCVVVCRADRVRALGKLDLGVELVSGGPTRTSSEMAGLVAVSKGADLVGVHDGARPAVSPALIESLFLTASTVGGAVPVLAPGAFFLDKASNRLLVRVFAVQTPQVFRSGPLTEAYSHAAREGFAGHDTVEVVRRYSDVEIRSVPGDPANVKVTFPGDLDLIRAALSGLPRT